MTTVQELLQIERSVVLRAPRSRVWRALTQKEEFGAWFRASIGGDFAPGGRSTMVVDHPGYAHHQFPIYVQRKEPETLFSWRWIPGDVYNGEDDASQMTEVTFTLEELPEGTRLTVVETGFEGIDLRKRAKAFESNSGGWTLQLERIEAYVRSQP